MLEDIKLLLNITDNSKDNLLNKLLTKSQNTVFEYCNNTFVDGTPQGVEDLIVELAIIRYNKLGSEGLQSESYSGISQTFNQDIPQDIKSELNKYRRLKTL